MSQPAIATAALCDPITEESNDAVQIPQDAIKDEVHTVEREVTSSPKGAMVPLSLEDRVAHCANVYLHCCNSCHRISQALHMPACLLCNSVNDFYEEGL